jgi:hypothetical protein
MTKAVEVAEAVEVEMRRRAAVSSERPSIARRAPGVVDAPSPRLPLRERRRAVEVAVPLVEVEMARMGVVWEAEERVARERSAQGEVVPMPRRWFAVSRARKFAEERVVAEE